MSDLNLETRLNLINFIKMNFSETDDIDFDEDEVTLNCPFCGGVDKFDINLRKGVGQCWRKNNCGWAGNHYQLVMDLSDVEFKDSKKILDNAGSVDNQSLINFISSSVKKVEDKEYSFQEEFPNSVPLEESEIYEEVRFWIENVRKYDFDKFIRVHNMFSPPQYGKGKGRVGFEVKSLENSAYQLYTFDKRFQQEKTYNCPGAYLSKLIYLYERCQKEKRIVFLTEGIFDCARLNSWGLTATCLFGTLIHPEQVVLLEELQCKEICICLDPGTSKQVFGDREKKKDGLFQILGRNLSKKVSALTLKYADPDDSTKKQISEAFGKRVFYKKKEKKSFEDRLDEILG